MKNRISLLWEYHCVRHSAVSILRHNNAQNDGGGRAYPESHTPPILHRYKYKGKGYLTYISVFHTIYRPVTNTKERIIFLSILY